MTEKGDLGIPSEPTISLPPNYAPSETYTDSPPPAYQRKNAPLIRITRMVCLTVLAVTFLVGFFIVAHRWVVARNKVVIVDEIRPHSQFLTAAEEELDHNQNIEEPLVKGASVVSLPIDNNKIEDDIELKGEMPDPFYPIEPESSTESQEDEPFLPEQVLPPEPFIPKGLLFPFQDKINKIRFPFGDIMDEGPKMMKPNGNCRVEKRSKNLGPGIKSESVIMICEDEAKFPIRPDMFPQPMPPMPKQSGPMGPMGPMGPPVSLLNNILKILSSKRMKNNMEEGNQPKVIKLVKLDEKPSILPPLPIRGDIQKVPPPIPGPPKGLFPLLNLLPIAKIEIKKDRPFEREEEDNDVELLPPLPPRIPINKAFPFPFPPMEDELKQREEFPKIKPQIKIIKINQPPLFQEDSDEMHDMPPFPFPLKPIMKLLPAGRQPRLIRIRPRPNEEQNRPQPPFPFPPLIFPHHLEGPFPHPMPEASGRALPAPVALPEIKMMRLPFTPPREFPLDPRITHMELKREPLRFDFPLPHDRQRSFTLSPFQKIYIPTDNDVLKKPEHKDDRHFPFTPNHPNDFFHNHEDDHFHDMNEEFGPPRTHTLIHHSPPVFIGDKHGRHEPLSHEHHHHHHEHAPHTNFHHKHPHPNTDPNFHTHSDGVAHSHPYAGPHTHIGDKIVPAETEKNGDPNFHTHEDGVSHSHPFDGPHTHVGGEIFPLFPKFQNNENFHIHEDGTAHSHSHDPSHKHIQDEMMPFQEQNSGFHSTNNEDNFEREQNPDFQLSGKEENFFISEPTFEEHEDYPLTNNEDLGRQEPTFEDVPPMFDDLMVFDEQPQIQYSPTPQEESQFEPEEPAIFLPDDSVFQSEVMTSEQDGPILNLDESLNQPEEPSTQDVEPVFHPENLAFQNEESAFQPEEAVVENEGIQPDEPTILIDEPLFRPIIPEEEQNEQTESEDNFHLDERGYAPLGRIAPNPPPIEDEAEQVDSEGIIR